MRGRAGLPGADQLYVHNALQIFDLVDDALRLAAFSQTGGDGDRGHPIGGDVLVDREDVGPLLGKPVDEGGQYPGPVLKEIPDTLAASDKFRTFPTASRRFASNTRVKTLGSISAETSSIFGGFIPIFSFPHQQNSC